MSNISINYEETFCAAVDEIINSRVQGLSFNTTLICKILDTSNAANGTYTVNDGSVNFTAYSSNTSYQKNDYVYVVVPNGDREEQCLIIGKKLYTGSTSYTFTSPFGTIIDITENLIDIPIKNKGLIANYGMSTVRNSKATMSEIIYDISVLVSNNRSVIEDDIYNKIKEYYTDYELLQKAEVIDTEKLEELQSTIYKFYLTNLTYIPVPESSVLYKEKTIANTKEIQAITLWEYEPEQPIAGYERLGIKGEFCSLLKNLNVTEGHYGLRLLLTTTLNNLASNTTEKGGMYELLLDSDDMNGNKFDFQGFYPQEKVFDISNFSVITKMELQFYQEPGSFKNANGETIAIEKSNNLFVNNPYVCLGYDLTTFGTDKIQLFSVSSQAYSATASTAANTKTIKLRWIHQNVNKVVKILNYNEIAELDDTEVRWYRYVRGSDDGDEYSGLYWKRIPSDDEGFKDGDLLEYTFIPNTNESTEQFKAIIKYGQYYYYSNILTFYNEQEAINPEVLKSLNALSLSPTDGTGGNYYRYNVGKTLTNPSDAMTSRKIVAYFNDEEINSEYTKYIDWTIPQINTMLVAAEEDCPWWEEIPIYVPTSDTKRKINKTYYIYQLNNYVSYDMNEAIGEIVPPGLWYNLNSGYYTVTTDITFQKDKIYYYKTNYIVYDGKEFVDGITYYEKDNSVLTIRKKITKIDSENTGYFTYRISSYYDQSYLNNTISAATNVSGAEYTASFSFNFGISGTSGSPYTLTLTIDPCEKPYLLYGDPTHMISVTAKLFNYENNEEIDLEGTNIEITIIEPNNNTIRIDPYIKIEGRPETASNIISWQKQEDGTYSYYEHGVILKANIIQAGMALTTYCSIPVVVKGDEAVGDITRAVAPTSIVYDSSGNIYYYKNKLKLYNKNEELNADWAIHYYQNGDWLTSLDNPNNFIPVIEDNYLKPVVMYIDDMPQICLVGKSGNGYYWHQRIITFKNKYPSAMIDNWKNGTVSINAENGSILSTMIAAGSKNNENQFSGVIMGDWEEGDAEQSVSVQTGLYGFHDGSMSFAFKEDGTAFIGTSSSGRLIFDGKNGSIRSGNYKAGQSGMLIDLDDGSIDAYTFKLTSRNIFINSSPSTDENGVATEPYFKITATYTDEDSVEQNRDLITMSDTQYYLQSLKGNMIIDLISGTIKIGDSLLINSDGLIKGAVFDSTVSLGEKTALTFGNNASVINGTFKNCMFSEGCCFDSNCTFAFRNEDGSFNPDGVSEELGISSAFLFAEDIELITDIALSDGKLSITKAKLSELGLTKRNVVIAV